MTRFDLAAFPQGQILAGGIAHNLTYRDEVFEAFAEIANAPHYDEYASLVTGMLFSPAGKSWSIATTAAYTKPVLNPPVYDKLRAIPNTGDTLHLTNISHLSDEAPTPPLYVWSLFLKSPTFMVSCTSQSRTRSYGKC